jgi:hypothetical protein
MNDRLVFPTVTVGLVVPVGVVQYCYTFVWHCCLICCRDCQSLIGICWVITHPTRYPHTRAVRRWTVGVGCLPHPCPRPALPLTRLPRTCHYGLVRWFCWCTGLGVASRDSCLSNAQPASVQPSSRNVMLVTGGAALCAGCSRRYTLNILNRCATGERAGVKLFLVQWLKHSTLLHAVRLLPVW